MKTLPFYIVLLHSLFLGIEPSLAQWVVKDTNKGAQQPLLQLVKDAFQSHQITNLPRLQSHSCSHCSGCCRTPTNGVVHALPP